LTTNKQYISTRQTELGSNIMSPILGGVLLFRKIENAPQMQEALPVKASSGRRKIALGFNGIRFADGVGERLSKMEKNQVATLSLDIMESHSLISASPYSSSIRGEQWTHSFFAFSLAVYASANLPSLYNSQMNAMATATPIMPSIRPKSPKPQAMCGIFSTHLHSLYLSQPCLPLE